jgi:hypothetical protein
MKVTSLQEFAISTFMRIAEDTHMSWFIVRCPTNENKRLKALLSETCPHRPLTCHEHLGQKKTEINGI